jgi:hypothetical protein
VQGGFEFVKCASANGAGDEREDGLPGMLGGEHEGQQDAPGVLAPVPRILGVIADGKSERPEVVLSASRGGGIEPVEGGCGTQDVDGPRDRTPADGVGVGVGLEVVDDRARTNG